MSPEKRPSMLVDNSRTASNISPLLRKLAEYPRQTSELLGVLVYNARLYEEQANCFDGPIPIGNLDMSTLLDMRIVRSGRAKIWDADNSAVPKLTRLGKYVVKNALIIENTHADDSLPIVDADALAELLS